LEVIKVAFPDSWTETALVEVSKSGDTVGASTRFMAITDTIDIDWGEKAIDWTATAVGGRIPTFTPETATTVTLELIPVGVAAPNGLSQIFIGNTTDASQPISSTVSRTRYKCRVVILWTDDTTATDASGSTAATKAGLRFTFADCYLTGLTFSFTDDILKATATFSCPPFNKAGTGKITVEENDGSGVLPSLGNYTA
jgi:hypothetical protein